MALSQIAVSVTSLADLIDSLNTFLTTGGAGNPGWTADHHVPGSGEWAISKDDGSGNSVEVAFQWDTSDPDYLGVYQYRSGSGAGNYNSGGNPYDQTDDSGNGAASSSNSSLANSRHVRILNSPNRYWAFTGDTYAHIVVEFQDDRFQHFGFGVLDKYNDWTGGEYAYGQRQNNNQLSTLSSGSSCLLDGLLVDSASSGDTQDAELFAATLHCEDLNNAPTDALWGVCMGNQGSGNLGQDRQSTPRDRYHILGGFRAGFIPSGFSMFRNSISAGYQPGYPIVVSQWDRTDDEPVGPLGQMKDVRGVNIVNFVGGDSVTVGSDTWYLFPVREKAYSGTGKTKNQGVAYLANA